MAPGNTDAQSPDVKEEDTPVPADEGQDSIFLSIRRIEAIRELSRDITPLRTDGSNLKAWVNELDETLADLVDREKYLQSTPPVPLNKTEDKVARSLIYRTIPRELRYSLRDASSAHAAYDAIASQFLRNTRTAHMSALVDLFNFRMEVTEAGQISLLYDQIYRGLRELVASGFTVTEDALLGALFQIALGRSNLELYSAVSQYFDTRMSRGNTSVTSQEVAAVARMQIENMGPIMSASDEAAFVHQPDDASPAPQAFNERVQPHAQQTAEPNLTTLAQQAAELNVNNDAATRFQASANAQHQELYANHSHPTQHPYLVQQQHGCFPNESSGPHIHQPVPTHILSSNSGPQVTDPTYNANGTNVWANQSGHQVSAPQQQANQPYALQVPPPSVNVCQANAAQQPPSEPTVTQAPVTKQATEHPESTLSRSTPVNSTSHLLVPSATGSGNHSVPNDSNLSKSFHPYNSTSSSSLNAPSAERRANSAEPVSSKEGKSAGGKSTSSKKVHSQNHP
ncbi:hypothetical protein PTTG_04719 [Puccinia triticina 1-1 BBBD Race 1]|uniref:Uncharacterized protein n=1 Tax=Puccinia triticina (isolate 1-1 / race 1 (BBBD)) TaxID=630390 RepID=A0A0C4EV87_PUCT1|nr:hypothetical protein PTTG_04719 [Puccinia triticina 1-1 BBBD Race 1]